MFVFVGVFIVGTYLAVSLASNKQTETDMSNTLCKVFAGQIADKIAILEDATWDWNYHLQRRDVALDDRDIEYAEWHMSEANKAYERMSEMRDDLESIGIDLRKAQRRLSEQQSAERKARNKAA